MVSLDLRCIDEADIFVFVPVFDTVVVVFEVMLRTATTVAIQKVMSIAACVRVDSENVPKLETKRSIIEHIIGKNELHPSVKTSLTLSQTIP
jgi:hypothetical protein